MEIEKNKRGLYISSLIAAGNITLFIGLCSGIFFSFFKTIKYNFKDFTIVVLSIFRDIINTHIIWSLVFVFLTIGVFFSTRNKIKNHKLNCYISSAIALIPLFLFWGYKINRLYLPDFFSVTSFSFNFLIGCGFLLFWLFISIFLIWLTNKSFFRKTEMELPFVCKKYLFGLLFCIVLLFNVIPLVSKHSNKILENNSKQVIVLLVDALRADRLSCYGYHRLTSPNIDQFANESVIFNQAISQSTFTKTSIASLFTSRYPYQHKVYWGSLQDRKNTFKSDILCEEEKTLAEILSENGFFTVAWVNNIHLSSSFGFDQGFIEYYQTKNTIEEINNKFAEWLDSYGKNYKFLSYIHYLDLHDPYKPKPPYDSMYGVYSDFYSKIDFNNWGSYLGKIRAGKESLTKKDINQLIAYYDGLINYIDKHIGKLLDDLKNARVYENSLIIVTADHGDGFMEHGFISHSTFPYDELLKVPLIIKFPKSNYAGKIVNEQVKIIDIMPTILDFLEIKIENEIEGFSLLNYLKNRGETKEDELPKYAISEIAKGTYPATSIRTKNFKHIHFEGKADEFYNLETDPREHNNIIDKNSELVDKFNEIQMKIIAQRGRKNMIEKVVLDEQTIRELKALGYIE